MSGIAGQGCPRIIPEEEKKTLEEIERSLVKKYRKPIWSKFIKAIKEYKLVCHWLLNLVKSIRLSDLI